MGKPAKFVPVEPNVYSPEVIMDPPVVEAIYGIQAVTPTSLEQGSVMDQLRSHLPADYTVQETMDQVNIELRREGDGPVQPKHTQLWSGAKLTSTDGKVVVHFMRFGMFANFLAYRSFDEALPLVQKLWGLYLKAFTPQLANKLSIRYINLLNLPFEDGRVDLDKYFKVYLNFPQELTNSMEHFHQQFIIRDPATQVPARVMISSLREEGDKLVVVFDQEGYLERQWAPEDTVLWTDLGLVRNWTYHVFRAILTDECLKTNNK